MNISGHIKLHRRIQRNPVWTQLSPAVFKLFMFLVMEANWKGETYYDGRSEIAIERGSFITSLRKLADACGLTLKQVREAKEHLDKLGVASFTTVLAHGRAHEATLVTVSNYDRYQIIDETQGHAKRHTKGTRRAHEGHTNKNEPVEIDPKANGISEGDRSQKTPLKEEEVEEIEEVNLLSGAEAPAQAKSLVPINGTRRGTRFSEPALPVLWAQYAIKEHGWSYEECQKVFENFADYWTAKSGKDATKLDWFATWRIWCRNEVRNRGRPKSPQAPRESIAEQMQRVVRERLERGERPIA